MTPDGEFTETHHVMVATRPRAGDWSSPTVLNPRPYFLDGVHLAVNRHGAAVATWVRGVEQLIAAYRPAGSATWTRPQSLARRGAFFNEVGIDGAGNAVAVYDSGGVQVRRFRPVTGWGPARRLSNPVRGGFGSDLAVSPSGAAVVSWEQQPRGARRAAHLTARMTPRGHWRAPVRRRGGLEVPDAGLGIDGRGVAVAAWWSRDASIVVQRSSRNGTWRRREVLARAQRGADRPTVKVATNARGDILVVWKARRGADPRLRARYRPASATTWSPMLRLTPPGVHANIYDTAVGPRGQAAVAWMRGRRVEARQILPCR